MSYFGLFVELPKKFKTFIYEEKNKIKNFSINEFVDHPPHITLATFSEPYKEIFEEISFKPTQILVQQKKYFTDENSNFTLYYDIKPDSSLIDLQLLIAILEVMRCSPISMFFSPSLDIFAPPAATYFTPRRLPALGVLARDGHMHSVAQLSAAPRSMMLKT